jgi:hypothetical protein
MKWPWVSRRAFDMVVEERDRLRVMNDQLMDHVKRINRVEHGLGELPRAKREPIETMPKQLRDYIDGFASAPLRVELRDLAFQRRIDGESWEEIIATLMQGESR